MSFFSKSCTCSFNPLDRSHLHTSFTSHFEMSGFRKSPCKNTLASPPSDTSREEITPQTKYIGCPGETSIIPQSVCLTRMSCRHSYLCCHPSYLNPCKTNSSVHRLLFTPPIPSPAWRCEFGRGDTRLQNRPVQSPPPPSLSPHPPTPVGCSSHSGLKS